LTISQLPSASLNTVAALTIVGLLIHFVLARPLGTPIWLYYLNSVGLRMIRVIYRSLATLKNSQLYLRKFSLFLQKGGRSENTDGYGVMFTTSVIKSLKLLVKCFQSNGVKLWQ